jgi:hypothetical protein
MASFPGFFSFPLIFCTFGSLSLCFCSLFQAQRPVLYGFRSPDQGLALQQPRCAIRGLCLQLFHTPSASFALDNLLSRAYSNQGECPLARQRTENSQLYR